jgi:hypothetical protein
MQSSSLFHPFMLSVTNLQIVDHEGHKSIVVHVQVFLLTIHYDQQLVLLNKNLENGCMGTSLKINF